MKIILASSSPRRREILSNINVDFEICTPPDSAEVSIDEKKSCSPSEFAVLNAEKKAEAVAKICGQKDAVVLGADTVVVLDDVILGKPIDADDAKRMLNLLSDRTHFVISGICVINLKTGKKLSSYEKTEVAFKKLSEEEIDSYIKSAEPFGKAGAYAIQGLASLFIPYINGCYFNVVGLPIFFFFFLIKEITEL